MNSQVHQSIARRKVPLDEKIFAVLCSRLNTQLREIVPNHSIYLAVDGCPPLAKMALQRERRLGNSSDQFDRSKLTPGSLFMNAMDTNLEFFACQKMLSASRQRENNRIHVVVDGSRCIGEGETKIIRAIREIKRNKTMQSVAVVSSDSDIYLSCCLIDGLNTSVYDVESRSIFSLTILNEVLFKKFPHMDIKRLKLDFVALTLFAGNDYVGRLRGLPTLPVVWQWYVKNITSTSQPRYLIDPYTQTINKEFLKNLPIVRSTSLESVNASQTKKYLEAYFWNLDNFIYGTCPDYRFYFNGVTPSVKDFVNYVLEAPAEQIKPKLLQSTTPMPPLYCYMSVAPFQSLELPSKLKPFATEALLKTISLVPIEESEIRLNSLFESLPENIRSDPLIASLLTHATPTRLHYFPTLLYPPSDPSKIFRPRPPFAFHTLKYKGNFFKNEYLHNWLPKEKWYKAIGIPFPTDHNAKTIPFQ